MRAAEWSLCEYSQRQSCIIQDLSTCLSTCAKSVRVGRPLLRDKLAENDPPPSKTPISNQYSLVVPSETSSSAIAERPRCRVD